MNVSYGTAFKRQLKRLRRRYHHVQDELLPVVKALESGEIVGDRIPEQESILYKVRLPNRDSRKGKSGGYRVIYYIQTSIDIVLVTIYTKSDQGDIKVNVLNKIISEIESE